jgi:murein DD-endopeptidase MepM/ murein hydrolase activator NlpD
LATIAILFAGGWIAGSFYPAPRALLASINPSAFAGRVRADLAQIDWAALRERLSEEEFSRMRDEAVQMASAAGDLIEIERVDLALVQDAAAGAFTLPSSAPTIAQGMQQQAEMTQFEATLPMCPSMTISNAPANADGYVSNYAPVVNVNGVALAVNPTRGACLSSGFGMRGQRQHKGVDYHSGVGGPTLAAAGGVIVEMKYRDDYGNMLLIDHGRGVYTRYAHLSTFQNGLAVGGRVAAGQVIGLMGNTASYAIPIHLHYEVLLGDYNNPRQSFGLSPHSPFDYEPS